MIVPDDGFSFVDCLDGTGFGAGVVMIFAPEYEKFFLLSGRQPGQYVSDIAFFGDMFSGFVGKSGGGYVAGVEFFRIVEEAHHEGLAGIDPECGRKESGHEGKPP